MRDLEEKKDFEVLKNDNFSVVMYWAEGCGVCDMAKPNFEKLEPKFKNYKFYKVKMTDETYGFYKKYEEEQKVTVPAVDEDGDPILDARGKQMTRNTMGYINQVPKYYVFHGSEATDEDQYGLLGKVDGHNLEQLNSILEQIGALEEQDNGEA